LRVFRWVLISRKEYERLKMAEKLLEPYQRALKVATEIAHSALKLVGT